MGGSQNIFRANQAASAPEFNSLVAVKENGCQPRPFAARCFEAADHATGWDLLLAALRFVDDVSVQSIDGTDSRQQRTLRRLVNRLHGNKVRGWPRCGRVLRRHWSQDERRPTISNGNFLSSFSINHQKIAPLLQECGSLCGQQSRLRFNGTADTWDEQPFETERVSEAR